MATVPGLPPAYADPTYQTAHEAVFSTPLTAKIERVLPPGVSDGDFSKAIEKAVRVLGKSAVFTGDDLKYYVDPYDIPEAGKARNIPSAAVW
ncbi:putative glycolate oxidase [Rosellinia necatrix]|uniref:Putative glycolate oxidase n=1 Tax=Rosellinia necatrix TaxID=77044 RepID=A0A1S8AA09_ROSNE|nr:putative glycolate oxidase [Rosellinia necatrix]